MKSFVPLEVFVVVLLMELSTNVVSKGLLGGPRDININKDEEAKQALKYAVSQYNIKSLDVYFRNVSEVLSAQRQMVEGVKYTFNVIMARTNCLKASVQELCVIQTKPKDPQACLFSVWSRPWLNSNIVNQNCSLIQST